MDEPPRPTNAPARAGRCISLSGLVGLGVCFFLPQVTSCDAPLVPARDFVEAPAMAIFFVPFLLAFAMLAVVLIRWFAVNDAVRRALSHVACAATLAAFLVPDACIAWNAAAEPPSCPTDPQTWILLIDLAFGTLAAISLWIWAPWRARIGAALALGGLCSLVYFCLFLGDALWGLYVSIASSAALLAGGVLEAWGARREAAPEPPRGPA